MAKYYKIRWQNKDVTELNRVVKNFNAKINRLAKANPSIKNLLPETVKAKELKELIYTRNDLKRELNTLQRFSKRGAEKIVKAPNTRNLYVTKWQKEELTRRVALVNRKRKMRKEEIYQLPAKSRGQELGYTVGQNIEYVGMGNIQDIMLAPMSVFTLTMTPQEVKMKYKSTRFQSQSNYYMSQDEIMRANYIKGLKTNYNYEDVKEIIKSIENMDIKEFMETFYEEGGTFEGASPNGKSDLKRYEYEGYVEYLKSAWL